MIPEIKKVLKTAFALYLVLFYVAGTHAQALSSPLPPAAHALVVIAHRGDHVQVPENTLAAYEQAILHRADYVEVDLRTTRDGHLVISHDATVNRMTNGKGAVNALSYAEIKSLVIHPAAATDTATYHIPDFQSVLQLCKNRIHIYLDFKDADVAATYRLIKAAGMEKQVVVYLNREGQYDEWKKVAPGMPLMASIPGKAGEQELNSWLEHRSINIVDNAYNEETVLFLHKKGIAVWLDVESEDEGPVIWDQALKLGVDGLQTDHPARLIQYLQQQGRR